MAVNNYQKLLSNKHILQLIKFIKDKFVYNTYENINYIVANEKTGFIDNNPAWILILKDIEKRFNLIIHINEHFISISDEDYYVEAIYSLDDEDLHEKITNSIIMISKISEAKYIKKINGKSDAEKEFAPFIKQ